MVLQYFFPLAVLIFTYTRIALAVWGKKAPGEAEDGRDQRLAKAKRKVKNPLFSLHQLLSEPTPAILSVQIRSRICKMLLNS